MSCFRLQTLSTNTINLSLITYCVNTALITPIENLIHYVEDVHAGAYHD